MVTILRVATRDPPTTDDEKEEHLFAGNTRFSLVSAMTSMLALGLPLEQVIPMVTSNAARMIGMQMNWVACESGAIADISVLSDERGRWILQRQRRHAGAANRLLQPLFCLRAGKRFDATAPILPSLSASLTCVARWMRRMTSSSAAAARPAASWRARLAENPVIRVLLLEAGGDERIDAVRNATDWMSNIGSERDWQFEAEPSRRAAGPPGRLADGQGTWAAVRASTGSSGRAVTAMTSIAGPKKRAIGLEL